MPSPNPRIQVCASPDLYARVKTLAKGRGITLSNMVQELCDVALSTDEISEEYQQACQTSGEVPVKEDKRQRPIARPWAVNYREAYEEAVADDDATKGLSPKAIHALVMAKREGRMTEEQENKTAEAIKESKQEKRKELLKSVLKELLED